MTITRVWTYVELEEDGSADLRLAGKSEESLVDLAPRRCWMSREAAMAAAELDHIQEWRDEIDAVLDSMPDSGTETAPPTEGPTPLAWRHVGDRGDWDGVDPLSAIHYVVYSMEVSE